MFWWLEFKLKSFLLFHIYLKSFVIVFLVEI